MRSLVAGLGLHHKGVLVLVHVIHGVPRPITADSKGQWVRAVPLESSLTKTQSVTQEASIQRQAGRSISGKEGRRKEKKKEKRKKKERMKERNREGQT